MRHRLFDQGEERSARQCCCEVDDTDVRRSSFLLSRHIPVYSSKKAWTQPCARFPLEAYDRPESGRDSDCFCFLVRKIICTRARSRESSHKTTLLRRLVTSNAPVMESVWRVSRSVRTYFSVISFMLSYAEDKARLARRAIRSNVVQQTHVTVCKNSYL